MRALGIILAGGNNNKMRELSNKRAVAAMPVAGSFRSIDFALPNGGISEENMAVCLYFLQPLHQITAGGTVERQTRSVRT